MKHSSVSQSRSTGWVLDNPPVGGIILLIPSGDYLVRNVIGFDPTDPPEPVPGECGQTEECFTPWFQKANCISFVEFESGQTSGTDCFGNIYDPADVFLGTENVQYIEAFAVKGKLEVISYPVITERSDNNQFINPLKRKRLK